MQSIWVLDPIKFYHSLGKFCRQQTDDFFFLCFQSNNWHGMSKFYFCEKLEKYFKMLSAEIFTHMLSINDMEKFPWQTKITSLKSI